MRLIVTQVKRIVCRFELMFDKQNTCRHDLPVLHTPNDSDNRAHNGKSKWEENGEGKKEKHQIWKHEQSGKKKCARTQNIKLRWYNSGKLFFYYNVLLLKSHRLWLPSPFVVIANKTCTVQTSAYYLLSIRFIHFAVSFSSIETIVSFQVIFSHLQFVLNWEICILAKKISK